MKYSLWFFLIFLFFTFCEKKDSINECFQFVDEVYDYPNYECTDAESLDCYEKRLKSMLLPEQYLKCSSTDSLIRTCLNYPYLGIIWAYNSLQQGYESVMNTFNGFDALFIREDVNILLIKAYEKMDPVGVNNIEDPVERGKYMAGFTYIEITRP